MTRAQVCHLLATWRNDEDRDSLIDWFDERTYPTRTKDEDKQP